MSKLSIRPRILFVTPGVAFVPADTGCRRSYEDPSQAGFAAVLTALIYDLYEMGVDVHLAQPDYRKIFAASLQDQSNTADRRIPASRDHLAEDRAFFYSNAIESNSVWENENIAIAFQREVSHQIVPRVQPDLIHCHDWMTGLIPAMARHWEIPCLFTVQNLNTAKSTLSSIENRGIDAAPIWQRFYYDRYPGNYDNTRDTNPVDFLLSGLFAADYVNTASPGLLPDIAVDQKNLFGLRLRQILIQKRNAGCGCEILCPLNGCCNPAATKKLCRNNDPKKYHAGKQRTKPQLKRHTQAPNHPGVTQRYINLYGKIFRRPLVSQPVINQRPGPSIKRTSETS